MTRLNNARRSFGRGLIGARVAGRALAAALLCAMLPASAQGNSAGAAMPTAQVNTAGAGGSATALDPALQRMFMSLAMSVLSSFATSAARGSLDAFDPGPAIESALKGALNNRDLNAVIDRLVAQAVAGSEGPGASPEMRAMLKAALSGVVAMARSEIARELSGAAPPAAQ